MVPAKPKATPRKKRTIIRTRPDKTTVGGRARARREELELSQADVAKRLGISRGGLAHFERGQTKNMTPENLFKLARILDIDFETLLFGEDRPRRRRSAGIPHK